MKLTNAMKKWLVDNCDVKQDATDDEFKKAAGEALAKGTLTAVKLTELQEDPAAKGAEEFSSKLDVIATGIGKLTELLAAKEAKASETPEVKTPETKAPETPAAKTPEVKAPSAMAKMVASIGGGMAGDDPTKDISVRVKEAAEGYATTKSAAIYPSHMKTGKPHPQAGRPIFDYAEHGRAMDAPSELELACIGAYCKHQVETRRRGGIKSAAFQSMNQHDKELLLYGMENLKWGGATDGGDYADICNRKLTALEQKTLIDDSTSGGLEAAPIVFDDMVIQAPLLNGELYPLIHTVPLDRGRRIEGVATGTVTAGWGGVDATAISLFDTTAYISAFDITIYRWEGAFKIGLDFLSDTPIDFAQHVTAQYGERLLEDLDDVIATGNGTTQPEGIITDGGTAVAWTGGVASLGNYESMRFAVPKNEHTAALTSTAVFCGTETSYQRARAIAVGASDARRLGGMDYSSYNWMERPYKINESLTNSQIFYAIMGRYRMYRRRGLTIRTSTEGDTLIRNNELLIAVTARYGGQLERSATAAVTTNAPA